MELPKEEVIAVVSDVGLLKGERDWITNTNVGEVVIDLVEPKFRKRTSQQIIAELREKTKDIPGITWMKITTPPTGPPVGKPVEVKVKGKYFEELKEVTAQVEKELRSMPGVFDVTNDFELGKPELRVKVDEDKASMLGLSVFQVASTIRNAYQGEVATVLRDADDEIDVIVKFPDKVKDNLNSLQELKIASATGQLVPFKNVATVEIGRGYSDIRRFNRERSITISADVDEKVTTATAVNLDLQKRFQDIEKRYPGYKLDFGGEFAEFKEAFQDLAKLFGLGIFLIYLILGTQFKSWFQPLIIMFTVPFSFVGAMIGLLIAGNPFSITTLYGMVALAGVVVNNAIVLIDFINHDRAHGINMWRALISSGKMRLRAIILTTGTTIMGLAPMAFGIGGKSAIWQPLANTIVWGLLASTILTLFVIPCVYAIFEDVKLAIPRYARALVGIRVQKPVREKAVIPETAD
jgi:multidrug efflux pump subunit AcrB